MNIQQINDEQYEKAWRKINSPKLEKIFLEAQIKYNQIRLKELNQQNSCSDESQRTKPGKPGQQIKGDLNEHH